MMSDGFSKFNIKSVRYFVNLRCLDSTPKALRWYEIPKHQSHGSSAKVSWSKTTTPISGSYFTSGLMAVWAVWDCRREVSAVLIPRSLVLNGSFWT